MKIINDTIVEFMDYSVWAYYQGGGFFFNFVFGPEREPKARAMVNSLTKETVWRWGKVTPFERILIENSWPDEELWEDGIKMTVECINGASGSVDELALSGGLGRLVYSGECELSISLDDQTRGKAMKLPETVELIERLEDSRGERFQLIKHKTYNFFSVIQSVNGGNDLVFCQSYPTLAEARVAFCTRVVGRFACGSGEDGLEIGFKEMTGKMQEVYDS